MTRASATIEALMTRMVAAGTSHDEIEVERRKLFLARVAAKRSELEPRINPWLLGQLRKTQTPCALLAGPSGIGKTSAAHWLLACRTAFFVRASRLGNARHRHALGEGDPPDVRNALVNALVVIDDLGTEDPRDVAAIQDVIDHRYATGRATIVTTGMTVQQLEAHIGVPYLRRLAEQHVRRPDGSKWPSPVIDMFGVVPLRVPRSAQRGQGGVP